MAVPQQFNQIKGVTRYNHLKTTSIKFKDFQGGDGKAKIYWTYGQDMGLPDDGYPDLRSNLQLRYFLQNLGAKFVSYNIDPGAGVYKYPLNWPPKNKVLRLPRVVRFLILTNYSDTDYQKYKTFLTVIQDILSSIKNLYIFDCDESPDPGFPATDNLSNRFIAAFTPVFSDIPDKFLGADLLNIVIFHDANITYYWEGSSHSTSFTQGAAGSPFVDQSYSEFIDFNKTSDVNLFKMAWPKFRRAETWIYTFSSGDFNCRDLYSTGSGDTLTVYGVGNCSGIFNININGTVSGENIAGVTSLCNELKDFGFKYKGVAPDTPSPIIQDIKTYFNIM